MRGSKKLLSLMLALVLTVTMLPAISAKASYGPKISKKKVTLYVGGTIKLKMKGAYGKVKWKSSNKKVATVNSKGKVKAKKPGKATIKAKVYGKWYSCKVKVKSVYRISSKNITVNGDRDIYINFYKASGSSIDVYSQDENIVYAYDGVQNGTRVPIHLSCYNEGTTYIVITNSYNNEKVKIKVTYKKSKSNSGSNNSGSNSYDDEKEPTLQITLPSVPYEGADHYSTGKIYKKYTITNVRYEKDYYSSDNEFSVKLFVSGKKTYDANGSNYSSSVPVGWKLYDSNGSVVETGTVYSPDIAVGESFTDAYGYIGTDLKPGCYNLVFIDTI